MWVVKLGGSLAGRGELSYWLDILAYHGGKIVLVPGGGPFADRVRDLQAQWAFSDKAAHAMALRAMEQYGLMMAGLQKGVVPVTTLSELKQVRQRAQVPVWLPVTEVIPAHDIPSDWSVTSDSLAAWLGQRLAASRLILVKTIQLRPGNIPLARLVEEGVVDTAFPQFLNRFKGETWLFHSRQGRRFQQALRSGLCHGATGLVAPLSEGSLEKEGAAKDQSEPSR